MARIVYGVAGEGSGHSSRAQEMAGHLQAQGHEVRLVSYDRGYRNLKEHFDVFETAGLHIASSDNRVSHVRTVAENLFRLPEGHKKLQALRETLFEKFKPAVVITDFEPMTAYLATVCRRPLITLDNQHRLRYMEYPCPPGKKAEQAMTEGVIRAMVPWPDVSLVTTFYFGRVTNGRTFLFPPILRRNVLDRSPTSGTHILVYLTQGFESFRNLLAGFDRETFLLYGADREGTDGPIRYRPFSRDGFLDDLASCKAVMATAGFTLISEALYLKKPYLALPMRGQFEQAVNGFLLERMQYGAKMHAIRAEGIGHFLYRLPEFRTRLQQYETVGNDGIKAKLDELLADDCALAREFRQHRKR